MFVGHSFGPDQTLNIGRNMKEGWPIKAKPERYTSAREDLQRVQLEKAGRHLAEVLNAIWP